jgi:hypothetical protein
MVEGYAVTSCNFASRETRNQAERICLENRSRGENINMFLPLEIFLSYDVALLASYCVYGPYDVVAKPVQERRVTMVWKELALFPDDDYLLHALHWPKAIEIARNTSIIFTVTVLTV